MVGRREHVNDAAVLFALSFAIAAPACLNERIHAGNRSIHHREIKVDACFHKAGGHHNASLIRIKERFNFRDLFLAMEGMHHGSQMKQAVFALFR